MGFCTFFIFPCKFLSVSTWGFAFSRFSLVNFKKSAPRYTYMRDLHMHQMANPVRRRHLTNCAAMSLVPLRRSRSESAFARGCHMIGAHHPNSLALRYINARSALAVLKYPIPLSLPTTSAQKQAHHQYDCRNAPHQVAQKIPLCPSLFSAAH